MLGDLKVSNQVYTTGDNFKIKYYINNEHKEAIYDGIACSIATATWVGQAMDIEGLHRLCNSKQHQFAENKAADVEHERGCETGTGRIVAFA